MMQIRIRSFWDVNNGVIGLLYSLITAAVFQVFVKWLIGGLRPHFLTVCKPDLSLASNSPGIVGAGYNAKGFKDIYYTREICTGDIDEIDDSLDRAAGLSPARERLAEPPGHNHLLLCLCSLGLCCHASTLGSK